jgi:hypothetical protein
MTRIAVGATTVVNGAAASLDHRKRIATLDDKMVGTTLASEIMAAAKMEPNIWRAFAIRLMNVTAEARVAFLNAIKADKSALTKGQIEFGIDDKLAKKRTNSATTRVSEMQAFANAWNSGASLTGLLSHANHGMPADKRIQSEDEVLAHVGYTVMLEYARTFSKSKAGRPSKTWVEKMTKFLEDNPVDADSPDAVLYSSIVALVNKAKTSGTAGTALF